MGTPVMVLSHHDSDLEHHNHHKTDNGCCKTSNDPQQEDKRNDGHYFNSNLTPRLDDMMRRKLRYHFMNPYQKYQAKGKLPWKMVLQIFKIILVTIQVIMFGTERAGHVSFQESNVIAFKHLFLNHWDFSHETLPYPPATGIYAIYTQEELYTNIDFALKQYNRTKEIPLGTYDFASANDTETPMKLCRKHFKRGQVYPYNGSFIFNSDIKDECIHLIYDDGTKVSDSKLFLAEQNKSINFDRILEIRLEFPLKTIRLREGLASDANLPTCFQFNIVITFDNSEHSGRVPIDLSAHADMLDECVSMNSKKGVSVNNALVILLDVFVIILSAMSFFLVIRSLIKCYNLMQETAVFVKHRFRKELAPSDRVELLHLWFVLIGINDLFTIVGSILKILIETKVKMQYSYCTVILGVGNLLIWVGSLRYLSFFSNYNILLLTMKRAFPHMLRFMVCAMVLYAGFCICGWVVLGPYHMKFRQLSSSSECLFSLINGDDMYVTFSIIAAGDKDIPGYVFWFSRVFLYGFISIFIYLVLSVFIAVIMDSFDTIKNFCEHGFPKTTLHEFINEVHDSNSSPLYRSDDRFHLRRSDSVVELKQPITCPCPACRDCLSSSVGQLFCCHRTCRRKDSYLDELVSDDDGPNGVGPLGIN